jgi:hypothetical protein
MVWTEGYSIENDVYTGSSVENLMEPQERAGFERLLDQVCEWFCFEIEECLAGRPSCEGAGIGRVLTESRDGVCKVFLNQRGFRTPLAGLLNDLRSNYRLKLRGKTLFSLLAQIVSAPDRQAKHSVRGLIEMCVTATRNPDHLTSRIEELRPKLNPQATMPF